MVGSSGGRKGKSCNQDGACEGASDIFGEVLFLDLGNGYRSLPYNNSLNRAFFCASVVCCVCTCMYTFSRFASVCGAEEKVNRGHLSILSRLLSANTRQLLKLGGLMNWCNALRFTSLH